MFVLLRRLIVHVLLGGRRVERHPAKPLKVNLRPGMRVQPRHIGEAVARRRGQKALHIPRGQASHTAQHRHGGSVIGAIAFLAYVEEIRHEVLIFRRFIRCERVAVIALQMAHDRACLFVWRGRGANDVVQVVVNLLLQVVWQLCVVVDHRLVIAVVPLWRGADQRAQTIFATLENRCENGISVPLPEVAGDKQLARVVKITHHIALRAEIAQEYGRKHGAGRCILHLYRNGVLVKNRACGLYRLGWHFFQKNALPQLGPARVNIKIPLSGRRIAPVPARIFIFDHSPHQRALVGLDHHHGIFAGRGLAAQPAAAHRVITIAAQRKHVARLGKKQIIRDRLLQVHRRLIKRRNGRLPCGQHQHAQGNHNRRHWQHFKKVDFLM